mmetsp:Transcript_116762/g.238862  ORF Transcript_116762/g.238862 Transcript_116762/m.238862 type:complete len:116 (-) Transcript_116762:68-415(-)
MFRVQLSTVAFKPQPSKRNRIRAAVRPGIPGVQPKTDGESDETNLFGYCRNTNHTPRIPATTKIPIAEHHKRCPNERPGCNYLVSSSFKNPAIPMARPLPHKFWNETRKRAHKKN